MALDSRGHGESQGEKTFDHTMNQDGAAALAWLSSQPSVDPARTGTAGASLGANLALLGAAAHPEIRSVAMLSPGMQLWQVGIQNAVVEYGARPLLLAAASEDAYPAGSSETLDDQALGENQLHIYPGSEHGTKMIGVHPELLPLLLDFFHSTLADHHS